MKDQPYIVLEAAEVSRACYQKLASFDEQEFKDRVNREELENAINRRMSYRFTVGMLWWKRPMTREEHKKALTQPGSFRNAGWKWIAAERIARRLDKIEKVKELREASKNHPYNPVHVPTWLWVFITAG